MNRFHCVTSAILAAAIASCSYATVPRVTNESPWRDEEIAASCSTGAIASNIDFVMAVVAGAGTIAGGYFVLGSVASCGDAEPGGDDACGVGYVIGAMVGVPSAIALLGYGFSARHGLRHGQRCRAERAKPVRD
jgi:hypothetical protein